MEESTVELHDQPSNEDRHQKMVEAGECLKAAEQRRAEEHRVRSRVKWKRVGDACTTEFFRASKAHTGASNITSLEDENGALITDQGGLEETCKKFYSKAVHGSSAVSSVGSRFYGGTFGDFGSALG